MRKPRLSVITSAPLAALLAVLSAGLTLAVAATTVAGGRVPGDAGLALIGALVLAAVAASEASRPQRSDRGRRRMTDGRQDEHDSVAGKAARLGHGVDIDLG
jgi:hypothetical protein